MAIAAPIQTSSKALPREHARGAGIGRSNPGSRCRSADQAPANDRPSSLSAALGSGLNIEVTKAAEGILTVRGRRDVEVIVVATKIVRGIARTPARELTRSAAPQPQWGRPTGAGPVSGGRK